MMPVYSAGDWSECWLGFLLISILSFGAYLTADPPRGSFWYNAAKYTGHYWRLRVIGIDERRRRKLVPFVRTAYLTSGIAFAALTLWAFAVRMLGLPRG